MQKLEKIYITDIEELKNKQFQLFNCEINMTEKVFKQLDKQMILQLKAQGNIAVIRG